MRYPWHATYHFRLFFSNNFDGNKHISFQDLYDPRGVIFQNVRFIFVGPMKGEWWISIYPWHVIYQFSVFFPNWNDGNHKNQLWALCGKIQPLLLHYPASFVPERPGATRICACFFCFFSFIFVFIILIKVKCQNC